MFTAEIRWFFDKPPSFQLLEHFLPFSEPSERTDIYLLSAGEKLGIKWREGKIEMKQQQGESQKYRKVPLAGEIEFWKKWSFNLDKRDDYGEGLSAQHWLPVKKKRKLARLAYDEKQQTTTPLPPKKESENVCEVEITQIQVSEQTHFTLGLEASGATSTLRENLTSTIDYLLKSGNLEGLDLSFERSNNYARWIQTTFSNQLPND